MADQDITENISVEETKAPELPPDQTSDVFSPIPVIPQLSVAVLLLVFVFGVTYLGPSKQITKQTTENNTRVSEKPTYKEATLSLSQAFNDVTIQAKSAFVWDVAEQKILFNKNGDDVRPLASITKLMTALVSYELLDPKQRVAISSEAIKTEGDSGFSDGEEFTVQNLTDLTLISSSNDGAAALGRLAGNVIDSQADAEKIFVEAMNLRAKQLGLSKTHYKNSTGLDISDTEAGATGSARDVALLMEYIITHARDSVALTTADTATIKNSIGETYEAVNTNPITDDLTGLIASKTGYTVLSGGNLVVALNMGLDRPIIVVVLGSTHDGRFSDVKTLTERAQKYIAQADK